MSMENLQEVVYSLLSKSSSPRLTKDDKERYIVLKILCLLLLWLEHDIFAKPVSEHVFVSVWSQILNTMLYGGGLRVIPGELASNSSKNCREITEAEFGKTAHGVCGRKVDLTIRVMAEGAWTGEIAVFECKPAVPDSTCTRQLKKSIRLNAAILLDLERQGLDVTRWFPIIAESRGLVLDFYTLKRYDDILGQHVLQYASEASSVLASALPSPFSMGPLRLIAVDETPKDSTVSFARSGATTHPRRATKRDSPFVLFSPSKSNKLRGPPQSSKRRYEVDYSDGDDWRGAEDD
ncbi:hypothetical protein BG003_011304 [Podila horticola]|nr:hypothetical protein BG003_011304 [Podila horticola]